MNNVPKELMVIKAGDEPAFAIDDLVNLLLHALIFFLHTLFHLLHSRIVLVDFLHLLKSLKILNLTHQLGE